MVIRELTQMASARRGVRRQLLSRRSFGSAGTECARRNGYHLQELKFWFEIPEPDDQGHGELVFTTLSRKVMPLLRYRTSDVAR